MSNSQQRFGEVQKAYFHAGDNFTSDLAACNGDVAKIDAVAANLQALETETYRAAKSVLTQTGDEVEAAYKAAKAAREGIIAKRKAAASIADLIKATAKNLDGVKALIDAAKTKTAASASPVA